MRLWPEKRPATWDDFWELVAWVCAAAVVGLVLVMIVVVAEAEVMR